MQINSLWSFPKSVFIEAVSPKDEIEASLAVQMVCAHSAAMAVLARLGGGHGRRHFSLRIGLPYGPITLPLRKKFYGRKWIRFERTASQIGQRLINKIIHVPHPFPETPATQQSAARHPRPVVS
jgi:hypothetical protein